MATKSVKARRPKRSKPNPAFAKAAKPTKRPDSEVHVFGKGFVCETDTRGHARPGNRSIFEIVVDASEGFVPLWGANTTLRWRFNQSTLTDFTHPAAAMQEIRALLGEALVSWGDAAPVRFAERDDAWDFEIVVQTADNCTPNGCVLASAFFPDGGRHQLRVYPKMFEQDRAEQVETLIHEIGHIFGLRHFFANVSEKAWPSQIFGTHKPFSIMNYGAKSTLTSADKTDLKRLYQLAWSGKLKQINGTPIKLVKPFHTVGDQPEAIAAATHVLVQSAATPCLGLIAAGEIVQAAIPGGPHDIDSSLEDAGLISDALRTVFREDVVARVHDRGCRIASDDVPNDAATTLREVRTAVSDNASR